MVKTPSGNPEGCVSFLRLSFNGGIYCDNQGGWVACSLEWTCCSQGLNVALLYPERWG